MEDIRNTLFRDMEKSLLERRKNYKEAWGKAQPKLPVFRCAALVFAAAFLLEGFFLLFYLLFFSKAYVPMPGVYSFALLFAPFIPAGFLYLHLLLRKKDHRKDMERLEEMRRMERRLISRSDRGGR